MSCPPPGWDEGEALEFSKALKQPMVLQTPLQVILEALFSRIQTQAGLFTDIVKRIDHMEAKEVPSHELMHRIKRCEDCLASINHEKLSPFYQQEILNRVEALEAQASAFAPLPDKSESSSRATTPALLALKGGFDGGLRPPSAQPVLEAGGSHTTPRISPLPGVINNASRLDALEQKLAGVYNLGGKLIALEQMAAEMEIDIPDTECTLSLEEQQALRQRALPPPGGPLDPILPHTRERRQSPIDSPRGSQAGSRPGSVGSVHSFKQGQPLPASPQGDGAHGTRPPTVGQDSQATAGSSQQPQPPPPQQQQLDNDPSAHHTNRSTAMTPQFGAPGTPPPRLGTAESSTSRSMAHTPRAIRQQTEQQLQELGARVVALQADNAELHRMLDELVHAHDVLEESTQSIQDVATSSASQMQAVVARIDNLQEAIKSEITAVAKEVHKPPEVSYADLQALTARVDHAAAELGSVSQSMQQIKTKDLVALHEQMADVLDQVKKAGQTRDMDTLFHNRLTQLEESLGDVKTEVHLAVADVLEDVVKVSDLQALEAQIDERASQEALRQVAQQQAGLAQSISEVANWIANRPSTDEGPKGPAAAGIKMKCFTCDQEIKNPTSGSGTRASDGSMRPKTNFLPKLDHPHNPSHSPSHTPTLPIGPGLNAAELRRLAEERMAVGGSKKGSPLRGADVEDYAADRAGASPGHSKSGRTPLPSHGLNSVVTRTPNRPPIFI